MKNMCTYGAVRDKAEIQAQADKQGEVRREVNREKSVVVIIVVVTVEYCTIYPFLVFTFLVQFFLDRIGERSIEDHWNTVRLESWSEVADPDSARCTTYANTR